MGEYDLREFAVGFDVPQFPAVVPYVRSWRERLLTLPWRPFQRMGERPSLLTVIENRMHQAEQAMRANLNQRIYG